MKTKKILSLFLAALLLVSLTPAVRAAEEDVSGEWGEDLLWTFAGESGKLTVTGSGAMPDASDGVTPWNELAEQIVSVEIGEGITSVGGGAFAGCVNLTDAVLPEGITKIGENAFLAAENLRQIDLPSSLETISKAAFMDSGLQEILLPEGVVTVAAQAFSGCSFLERIDIPSSVVNFDESACAGTYGLTTVINKSETAVLVPSEACYDELYYRFLKSLLPVMSETDALSSGLAGMFYLELLRQFNAGYGTDFELTLRGIGEWIGYLRDMDETACLKTGNSPWLTVYCLENSAQHGFCAETGAKHRLLDKRYDDDCGCAGVAGDAGGVFGRTVYWSFDEESGKLSLFGSGMMPYGNEQIPWQELKRKIKTVEIEDGILNVSGLAFADCRKLESVVLPDSVSCIGFDAFTSDGNLRHITLPSSLRYISEEAFLGSGLREIVIPEGVIAIGTNAFTYCYYLSSIEIPASVIDAKIESPNDLRTVINRSETAIVYPCIDYYSDPVISEIFADLESMFSRLYEDEDPMEEYIDALKTFNAGFGTDFSLDEAGLNGMFEYVGAMDPLDYISEGPCPYQTVSCTDASAQHRVCIETGAKHVLTDKESDCGCGVHRIYENDVIEPDCTHNGYSGGKVCLDCEEVFEAPAIIPAPGHTVVTDPASAPTCSDPGLTEGTHCAVCGAILSAQEILPAAGHTDGNSDGVCDVCGESTDEITINQPFVRRLLATIRSLLDSIIALFRKLFG